MAHWEPQKLATKLCRILDGRLCDIATFARLCEESPRTIEWIVKHPGGKIPRDAELRIGRVVATFLDKYPDLMEHPAVRNRGVFEQATHRKDERAFALYDSRGKWRGTHIFPANEVDEGTIAALWRVLEKKDPTRLKVI